MNVFKIGTAGSEGVSLAALVLKSPGPKVKATPGTLFKCNGNGTHIGFGGHAVSGVGNLFDSCRAGGHFCGCTYDVNGVIIVKAPIFLVVDLGIAVVGLRGFIFLGGFVFLRAFVFLGAFVRGAFIILRGFIGIRDFVTRFFNAFFLRGFVGSVGFGGGLYV